MAKKISIIGKETNKKVLNGFGYMAAPVRRSMGPFGRNNLSEKGNTISNDGARIARVIAPTIKDPFERRVALTGLESASNTETEAFDGTSATITLCDEILKKASDLFNSDSIANKQTPATVIDKVYREVQEINKKLVKMAVQIETEEELINSATVSAEVKSLGELIGKAQWKLGKDGVLIAEETAERECSVEFVNGIRIDNGFGTSFAVNNPDKGTLEVKKTHVIMTSYTVQELAPLRGTDVYPGILRQLYKMGVRDIVIIARAFGEQALRDCETEIAAGFRIFPVNAPYSDQNEIMQDLVAVLGGKYVTPETGKLEQLQLSDVGFAESIVAKRYTAIIAGSKNEKAQERVDKRVADLKARMKNEASQFEKKNIKSRISQLTTGFGIVKVGAISANRRRYLKDKADDAVGAVAAAWQEGVVPGAGLAFKQIADELPEGYFLKDILPCINREIMNSAPEDFKVEDWVRDPVKVLRIALVNAVDTAMDLATLDSIETSDNPHQCKCAGTVQE